MVDHDQEREQGSGEQSMDERHGMERTVGRLSGSAAAVGTGVEGEGLCQQDHNHHDQHQKHPQKKNKSKPHHHQHPKKHHHAPPLATRPPPKPNPTYHRCQPHLNNYCSLFHQAILDTDLLTLHTMLHPPHPHIRNIQNPNPLCPDGWPALFHAIHNHLLKSALFLIQNGHERRGPSVDFAGNTALMIAVRNDCEECAEFLCTMVPDMVRVRNEKGKTPLAVAAERGLEFMAERLLRLGAEVGVGDEDGNTALHSAATYGYFNLIRVLIAHGADPYVPNNDRWTPLDYAHSHALSEFIVESYEMKQCGKELALLPVDGELGSGAAGSDGGVEAGGHGGRRAAPHMTQSGFPAPLLPSSPLPLFASSPHPDSTARSLGILPLASRLKSKGSKLFHTGRERLGRIGKKEQHQAQDQQDQVRQVVIADDE